MKIYGVIAMGLLLACQTAPRYTLSGKLGDYSGKVFLVVNNEKGQPYTLAQTEVKGGRLKLTGDVQEPQYAWIQLENSNVRIPLLLENADYQIVPDPIKPNAYCISGGILQLQREEFRQVEKALRERRDSLKREYRKYAEGNEIFAVMHIRALMMDLDSTYEEEENLFIKTHNNIVGASLIRERLPELLQRKWLNTKYVLLGDSARNTSLGKELSYYLNQWQTGEVGMVAPDFTLKTPDGKPVSLYGVKAKAKIIDFWASWCGPCRAQNPNVRRMYDKYHDQGLEIISVSLDSKMDPWLKAIEKDQLPWIHVSDLNGWESAVAKMYGIKGIPHIFVLDENNRIIGEKLYGEELEKYILKALK